MSIDNYNLGNSDLQKQIDDLKKENFRLSTLLAEYGITDDKTVSDQEWICIKEIERLRQLSSQSGLDDKEITALDTLTKVLQREREGTKNKKSSKGKKESIDNLLKIAASADEPA